MDFSVLVTKKPSWVFQDGGEECLPTKTPVGMVKVVKSFQNSWKMTALTTVSSQKWFSQTLF
jgi:hypothetical protein